MAKLNYREISELKKILSERLLEKHGYAKPPEGQYDIEWDVAVEDSQLSAVYEDVKDMIEILDDLGYTIHDSASQVPQPTVHYASSNPYTTSTQGAVSSTYTIPTFSTLSALIPRGFSVKTRITVNLGLDSTISDMKKYIEQLEMMGVSEDEELAARSHIVTLDDCVIERIACGECNFMDYLIITPEHECLLERPETIE